MGDEVQTMIDEPTNTNGGQNAADNGDVLAPPHKPSPYKEKAEEYEKAASAYFGVFRERVLDADSWWWKWVSKAFGSASFWTAAATVTIAIATIVHTHYARDQWDEMTKAPRATQDAAYAACINAQISQRNLLEIQRTNSFSQTMAVSSTMQAAAEIDTERAYITFDPRFSKPGEMLSSDPNFEIVYSVKNDGKSAAKDFSLGFKAILVSNDEVLKIGNKGIPEGLHTNYFPAGTSIPGIPEVGRPVTFFIPVVDNNGISIAKASEKVQKVLADSAIIAVIEYIKYSDFAGTHKAKFCNALWQMQPGTQRIGTRANETACAKYNQQKDDYAFTAKTPLAIPQEPLLSITCATPRN
jgi:hypothetical protein